MILSSANALARMPDVRIEALRFFLVSEALRFDHLVETPLIVDDWYLIPTLTRDASIDIREPPTVRSSTSIFLVDRFLYDRRLSP